MDFASEFKRFFRQGGALTQLILINITVYLSLKILGVIFFLFQQEDLEQLLLQFLALPADPGRLLVRPWTILTYMFLHYDLLHILFNMLWFFWFGKIFLEYLNAKQLLSVYLFGGLSGGRFFVLATQLSKGRDLSRGFNRVADSLASLFRSRRGMRVKYKRSARNETDMEYNARKASEQQENDRILDKITKGGYESLTREEKDALFR